MNSKNYTRKQQQYCPQCLVYLIKRQGQKTYFFTLYTLILKCYTNTQITHSKLKWSLGPKDKRESCDCWVFWLSRTLLGRCLQCPLRFSFSVACAARLPSFLRVLELVGTEEQPLHFLAVVSHCYAFFLAPAFTTSWLTGLCFSFVFNYLLSPVTAWFYSRKLWLYSLLCS